MNSSVLYRTLVFTDLAGSTALFEERGDAAALATIRACQQIMKRVIVQHGGELVKTLGDGVMAVFGDAATALQAAWLMVQVVAETPSNPALRAGVHYGEVLSAGEDYFGDTVNVAARLLSEAKPGQVVTSLQTVLLLPEELQPALYDLGVCQVRGRAGTLNLYLFQPETTRLDTMDVSDDVELAPPHLPYLPPREQALPSSHGMGLSRLGQHLGTHSVLPKTLIPPSPGKVLALRWAQHPALPLDANCPVVCLGADSSNEIVLCGEGVSPTHARIEWQEEAYVLVDQSNAGTWVQQNGQAPLFLRHEQIPLQGTGWISLGTPFLPQSPHLSNEENSSSSLVHFHHLLSS